MSDVGILTAPFSRIHEKTTDLLYLFEYWRVCQSWDSVHALGAEVPLYRSPELWSNYGKFQWGRFWVVTINRIVN